MFTLRLGDKLTTLTLVPMGDVKKLAMEVTRIVSRTRTRTKEERIAFIIEAREILLINRALEVMERTMAGRTFTRYKDLDSGTIDDGRVRGFIPRESPDFDGPVALLHIINPGGAESAVYLDESNLMTLAEWANEAAFRIGGTED
jgi:hypothetical protein